MILLMSVMVRLRLIACILAERHDLADERHGEAEVDSVYTHRAP